MIKINGIKKNKSILKELEKITRKTEKYPFIESNISNVCQLNNIIRMNGFYFANIDVQVIDNNNNSVNLFYNFDLGQIEQKLTRYMILEIKFLIR